MDCGWKDDSYNRARATEIQDAIPGGSPKNSYRFFSNPKCEFHPCHKLDDMSCKFCYCPLYQYTDCGGTFTFKEKVSGHFIKDCSQCVLPHTEEGYNHVIEFLKRDGIPTVPGATDGK
jgi:Zn-finger protein